MIHPPDQPTALPAGGDNSLAYLIGVTADEWTLLILRYALGGVDQFDGWLDRLPITPALLAGRLRRMSEMGILFHVDGRYLITRRGAALWPMITTIAAWEGKWGGDTSVSVPALRHVRCGAEFVPLMSCGTCGDTLVIGDVSCEFGPSGSWPRSSAKSATRRHAGGSANLGPGYFPHSRALIGNHWSAVTLGAAYLGATRFSQFYRSVGAHASVIADRLRVFGDLGVLAASGDSGRADRLTYELTDKGREFFPVVLLGVDWSSRWFVSPEGPAVDIRHRGADHRFRVVLICSACDRPLAGREIEPF